MDGVYQCDRTALNICGFSCELVALKVVCACRLKKSSASALHALCGAPLVCWHSHICSLCVLVSCPLSCVCNCEGPDCFAGKACNYLNCPTAEEGSECSGYGKCQYGKPPADVEVLPGMPSNTSILYCACKPGYGGPACNKRTCATAPNGGAVCNGKGKCYDTTGTCMCKKGWLGKACGVSVCPVGSKNRLCAGNGNCSIDTQECTCEPGYSGPACDEKSCSPACQVRCAAVA